MEPVLVLYAHPSSESSRADRAVGAGRGEPLKAWPGLSCMICTKPTQIFYRSGYRELITDLAGRDPPVVSICEDG